MNQAVDNCVKTHSRKKGKNTGWDRDWTGVGQAGEGKGEEEGEGEGK